MYATKWILNSFLSYCIIVLLNNREVIEGHNDTKAEKYFRILSCKRIEKLLNV